MYIVSSVWAANDDGFDIITSTTHKTLRGPRGGIILTRENEEIAKKIDKDGNENKAKGYRFIGLRQPLRDVGVFNNKHIPVEYLLSSKK